MCPNINICNATISSWHVLLLSGAFICIALIIYLRPRDFIMSRKALACIGFTFLIMGLLGSRILHIILHQGYHRLTIPNIFLMKNGFAYFGALLFNIIAIAVYSIITRKDFSTLADYLAPFLILSQAFVRVGCFMAGCCYGRPTGSHFGITFESVDNIARHPTQIYEAILLITVYLTVRVVYGRWKNIPGKTFLLTLFLYCIGRFFIEFFRVDSPPIFMGITFAQAVCLFMATYSGVSMLRLPSLPKYNA